jgi:hypothetical protein
MQSLLARGRQGQIGHLFVIAGVKHSTGWRLIGELIGLDVVEATQRYRVDV